MEKRDKKECKLQVYLCMIEFRIYFIYINKKTEKKNKKGNNYLLLKTDL